MAIQAMIIILRMIVVIRRIMIMIATARTRRITRYSKNAHHHENHKPGYRPASTIRSCGGGGLGNPGLTRLFGNPKPLWEPEAGYLFR